MPFQSCCSDGYSLTYKWIHYHDYKQKLHTPFVLMQHTAPPNPRDYSGILNYCLLLLFFGLA